MKELECLHCHNGYCHIKGYFNLACEINVLDCDCSELDSDCAIQAIKELKAENARLTEQLKNAVVLPCIRPFNNGNYGIVYEVLEWDNASGFMTRPYDTLPEAEARLAELKEKK